MDQFIIERQGFIDRIAVHESMARHDGFHVLLRREYNRLDRVVENARALPGWLALRRALQGSE